MKKTHTLISALIISVWEINCRIQHHETAATIFGILAVGLAIVTLFESEK